MYKETVIGVPQGTLTGPILWNIFVDTLRPETDHMKYADDTTVYSTIQRKDVDITQSSSTAVTLSLHHNNIQVAADYAIQWSCDHFMQLNTSKTKAITFSLKKIISMPPVNASGVDIEDVSTSKLLGVVFDRHMKFNDHVHHAINKTRSAFHALVQLKRASVNSANLILFYRTRILSILCYAAPSWYPYVSETSKQELEKHQKLCLKIVFPNNEHYIDRLSCCHLPTINTHLSDICSKYISKISTQPEHPLYNYLTKASQSKRRSTRLHTETAKHRTALFENNIFYSYR
jgi:hypothetical protein